MCHMTKSCNISIMNGVASPFWDENEFTLDFYDYLICCALINN